MKFNYFLKSFALIALMLMFVNVNAAEFRIPNNSTDADLVEVLEMANDGDVIWIDGWVIIENLVHIEKNVNIRAGVANAGFDAEGNTRMFEINPAPVNGQTLLFFELGFTNGNGWGIAGDSNNGGVARIHGGVVEFVMCYFEDNEARRGGAFEITGNADNPATIVNFKGCDAFNNIAVHNGEEINESRGGYLFADGNSQVTHEFCRIRGNQSIGGRGGAFAFTGTSTQKFFYCDISNNLGGKWTTDDEGQPLAKVDPNGNVTTTGEYEGGVAFIYGTGSTIFESCCITGNQSWSHSAIIRGDNDNRVTFINTTLAGNRTLHDRSPIWASGGTYTFVNSLFVDNKGQNQGNGAGFDADAKPAVHLNIFNSIFARNIAGGDGAVDIREFPNPDQQITVKNSIIGFIQGTGAMPVAQDNANIPTKSIINMYKLLPDEMAAPTEQVTNFETSGVNFSQGMRFSTGFGMGYYLLEAGSTVTKLGDPALLANEETMDDLFTPITNKERSTSDGFITAAPTIASTVNNFNDKGWEKRYDDYDYDPSGIFTPQLAKESIKASASNGILAVDFGELRGQAKGTLLSIAGQEVEQVFNTSVVSKGFYAINVTPGMYILKVEMGGKTYAQKLIVTK